MKNFRSSISKEHRSTLFFQLILSFSWRGRRACTRLHGNMSVAQTHRISRSLSAFQFTLYAPTSSRSSRRVTTEISQSAKISPSFERRQQRQRQQLLLTIEQVRKAGEKKIS
jgi:hypothetical protein